jgi:thiamine transport system permease protein
MAERGERIVRYATFAAVFIAVCLFAGLVPVFLIGVFGGEARGAIVDPYLFRIFRFTLLQASLSTLLSIALGVPLAVALSRARFHGRALLLRLFAIPFALPAIVAILGIVTVFGRNGWLGGWFDLYGLAGILLAHVFFNMPLVARLVLSRLEATPEESRRLAAQLGFDARAHFRLITWPVLRASLPGIASLVFLLCTASFAVILTLGGGPAATTLEVAIYQALRFDYDPARAVALAIMQLALCALLVLLAGNYARGFEAWSSTNLTRSTVLQRSAPWDIPLIAFAAAFVIAPLAALVAAGLAGHFATAAIATATATSLAVATAAASLAVLLAFALAQSPSQLLSLFGLLTLVVPPAVLATGWFIAAIHLGIAASAGPPLVILMNALMALPFALSALVPAIRESALRHDRLCTSLGLFGPDRLRLVDLPFLARPLALAFAMCLAVSLGDLTAIMLFGTQDFVTLPSLIFRQMGVYRLDEAATTALALLVFSVILISLAEFRRSDDRS